MNPTILALGSLFLLFVSSFQTQAQQTHFHQIPVEVQSFSKEQASSLDDFLKNNYSFQVLASCPEEGFILVGFPTSAPMRMPQAESIVLEAIEESWQKEGKINRELNREDVLNCAGTDSN